MRPPPAPAVIRRELCDKSRFLPRISQTITSQPIACLALCWGISSTVLLLNPTALGQTAAGDPSANTAENVGASKRDELKRYITALNDPSFRVRQDAQWHLSRNPKLSVAAIKEEIGTANHNAGSQLVELLTEFALSNDSEVSFAAVELLESTADRLSSVGRLSQNALEAISDLHEEQAIEKMMHQGALIGPRTFSLNGQLAPLNEVALYIGESFTGDKQSVQWIRYIESVETVCLEGPAIDRSYLEAVAQMPNVTAVKLKHVTLKPGDLRVLSGFTELEHLGLIYVDAGDEIVDDIKSLPLSGSLKLYGTQISQEAADKLVEDLASLEIFYGQGGFLGVGPATLASTRVMRVTPNSAAMLANIQIGDVLTHVNGIEVETFDDLRNELGKYPPKEEIAIKLIRDVGTPAERELEVFAVLKEEP